MTEPIWVDVDDAIRLTGCGRTTVYKLINEGRLKSTTAGRKRLVSVKSIEELGDPTPALLHPLAACDRAGR
jgi:excisionase family DNA binding protein